VLIIGPKGTGKTSLVRDFAKNKNVNLESVNFSLRTRESHLVGTKTLTDGTVSFDEGIYETNDSYWRYNTSQRC